MERLREMTEQTRQEKQKLHFQMARGEGGARVVLPNAGIPQYLVLVAPLRLNTPRKFSGMVH